MKATLAIFVSVFLFRLPSFGGDQQRLEPNSTLCYDFPELPDTLLTKATGRRQPARLTAQLPANYSSAGTFPLFVFLNGGDGGPADSPVGRVIVGPRDFVCVNMPLFKRTFDTNENGGLLISIDDFQTASGAYRVMLQRLLGAVPNIATERSAFGGGSNGAHITAVLLAGQDEFILQHFRAFFFWEGGVDILAGHVLEKASSKHCRFLLMRGDQPMKGPGFPEYREYYTHLTRALEYAAKAQHLDFTSIVVRGYGHEFPSEYFPVIDAWVRQQKLPEINPK
jgi:hypothetical protein